MNLLKVLPEWVWLVPLLSFLAAAITGLRVLSGRAQGDAAEPLTARLAALAAFAALALLLAIDLAAILYGEPGHRLVGVWFSGDHWTANLSFLLDALSLPVATLVALIGWLVMRFSANYLHREAGFHRFFMVLGMFLSGMQLVLLAGNGLIAFVGWEMCGVASFLLIGYAWQRPLATGNALFAFVTNRAGDAGFLLALGFAGAWLGSFEWPVLNAASGLSLVGVRLLLIGFVLAALVKSAQFPFTPWIARALEGPTPSSAIFYGAVMVHAGVYLLLRLSPLLQQVPDVMLALIVVGGVTALYAWLCALVQTDIKSALVFATVFQVALMFVAIGLGWTTWALIHLCLHAAWRSWQFLLSPSWLVLTHGRPAPPPRWLCQQQWLYTAVLQRFWLDRLGDALLLRPTQSFAHDLRGLEENFIDRLLGQPGQGQALDAAQPLIVGDGVPGLALARTAESLQQLENHFSLRGRGGLAEQCLLRAGLYLQILENLLEQPRYLMMAVMATFVVIL
jgi:NADH:ubiquinone oxidoreductase subunit 5 (subunit L)/multisubunit Na+/H+ antiporter MnhA subunit